jgi:[citrate (pro-3S)-lyase] ligase
MIAELYSPRDIRAARDLMEQSGLLFESDFDELVGVHEADILVAVGARSGNILKMFAVEPSHQGGPLLAEVVTELVGRGLSAGFGSLFVYTKPEYVTTFESFNFSLLASQGQVALLEYGRGLERWLASHRSLIRSGTNGAVVMNCNPFTRGHRHLVEQAARQVDTLYLFIVAEERSLFPFPIRMGLVRAGVADIPDVLVLGTSHYAVSNATFPTLYGYFSNIMLLIDLPTMPSVTPPFRPTFSKRTPRSPASRWNWT